MTSDTVVETLSGRVRGTRLGPVEAFLGIPYAGRVSGAGRFAEAPDPEPWAGVRDATVFGPAAPQSDARSSAPPVYAELLRLFYPGSGSPLEGRSADEDALVLNVWTPGASTSHPRPVMVWLHGGAFLSGTGAEGWFQGDRLADRGDVVVVTLNHRLGLLGFLPPDALDDRSGEAGRSGASGVVGMLDIVQALRWVRANIRAFGGDPDSVTVFGQSGGAVKTLALTGMPAAQGLFHRIALQSAPIANMVTRAQSRRTADVLRDVLGRTGLHSLLEAPVPALLAVQDALVGELGPLALGPVLTPEHLPVDPSDPAGDTSVTAVPAIIGTTRHEYSAFAAMDPSFAGLTHDDLPARFEASFGGDADSLLEQVRALEPGRPPQLVLARALTDATFGAPLRTMVSAAERRGVPAFVYRLDHETDALGGVLGAHHSADLPLVFRNADRSPIAGSRLGRFAAADAMSDAWVTFARTGRPTLPEGGRWADSTDGPPVSFDTETRALTADHWSSVPELRVF